MSHDPVGAGRANVGTAFARLGELRASLATPDRLGVRLGCFVSHVGDGCRGDVVGW